VLHDASVEIPGDADVKSSRLAAQHVNPKFVMETVAHVAMVALSSIEENSLNRPRRGYILGTLRLALTSQARSHSLRVTSCKLI
jgi:hypothetical protein